MLPLHLPPVNVDARNYNYGPQEKRAAETAKERELEEAKNEKARLLESQRSVLGGVWRAGVRVVGGVEPGKKIRTFLLDSCCLTRMLELTQVGYFGVIIVFVRGAVLYICVWIGVERIGERARSELVLDLFALSVHDSAHGRAG